MLRLGLQLSLRSGREAMVRLLITAAAVAGRRRGCSWACSRSSTPSRPTPTSRAGPARRARRCPPRFGARRAVEYSVDFYQGQTISRLDVAALGPNAPVAPGITRLPPAGDYYASPALAALLKTVPADQLGCAVPWHDDRHDRPGGAQRARRPGHLHRAHNRSAQRDTRYRVGHVDRQRAGAGGVLPVLPLRVRWPARSRWCSPCWC